MLLTRFYIRNNHTTTMNGQIMFNIKYIKNTTIMCPKLENISDLRPFCKDKVDGRYVNVYCENLYRILIRAANRDKLDYLSGSHYDSRSTRDVNFDVIYNIVSLINNQYEQNKIYDVTNQFKKLVDELSHAK